MTSRLEQAIGRLSQAVGEIEDHLAKMPSGSVLSSASVSDIAPPRDSLKKEIKDIEAMMSEAIAILEQNASGEK